MTAFVRDSEEIFDCMLCTSFADTKISVPAKASSVGDQPSGLGRHGPCYLCRSSFKVRTMKGGARR
jgi:hypothetical protein